MSNIRVMIFIDGSNLHWGIKGYNKENKTNLKIDYAKLISLLLKNRALVRVIYYCSKPIPPGRTSQIKFIDYIRSLGIQVIEKPLKTRCDPITKSTRYVEKSVDVALATDLIGMAWENAYDVAVIVSGDADYVGAVSKVMSKGKNVEVASLRKCLSKELREAALIKIILDDYIPQIKI
ncbi:MAG: NYN domain-containing protein [Candidatus Bathyarchaeia archaeon]